MFTPAPEMGSGCIQLLAHTYIYVEVKWFSQGRTVFWSAIVFDRDWFWTALSINRQTEDGNISLFIYIFNLLNDLNLSLQGETRTLSSVDDKI